MARDLDKLNNIAYLRDLAERLMRIPVMYGTDQYDTDRLCLIARDLQDEPKGRRNAK